MCKGRAGFIDAPGHFFEGVMLFRNPIRRFGVTGLVLAGALGLVCSVQAQQAPSTANPYDENVALEYSQSARGRTVGDYSFVDEEGAKVRLADLAGKPVLVSMIYTSCHHICPMTTKNLAIAVAAAREVFGDDSFHVLTVGFDFANDTPDAMRNFRRQQAVQAGNWYFLSGDQEAIDGLARDVGFIYFPSPRGFDHLNQVTILDRNGVVYEQVYGMKFELPWLVEPLKQLIFNRPESVGRPIASLVDRVRLFCTVYDPASGRYEFDKSLFIQIAIGFLIVLSVAVYLFREFRKSRRKT